MKSVKIVLLVCLLLVACFTVACKNSSQSQQSHVHSYGEWSVSKAPTCIADGTKERYCSCGEVQSAYVAATGHKFGDWVILKEATCTVEGSEERICSCGEKETRKINASGHVFNAWQTTKEATCTEDGSKERVCNCGEKENQVIVAAHSWIDATCEEPAICTVCNQTDGVAWGHSYDEKLVCVRCSRKYELNIILPDTPFVVKVVNSYEGEVLQIGEITSIRLEYEYYKHNNAMEISVYWSGVKT